MVSAPGGAADPELAKVLEKPEVLGRFERHYVFVRVDPKDAPPELADFLRQAGPSGLVLLDLARSVDGFGESQSERPKTYPKVLAVRGGPPAKSAVVELLARHVAPREAALKNP